MKALLFRSSSVAFGFLLLLVVFLGVVAPTASAKSEDARIRDLVSQDVSGPNEGRERMASEAAFRSEARRAGQDLLGRLEDETFDPTGTWHYSIALRREHGQSTLGRLTASVSRASRPAGGFRARLDIAMTLGPVAREFRETTVVNRRLGLVSQVSVDAFQKGREELRRSDGVWVCRKSRGETSVRFTLPVEGDDYNQKTVLWMLMARLPWDGPADYMLGGVLWPRELVPEPGRPVNGEVWIHLEAPAPGTHRGVSLETRRVRCLFDGGETSYFLIDRQGRVLSMWDAKKAELSFILGTEAEVSDDLSGAARPPAEQAVVDCVMTYVEVISGSRDVGELDPIMDWESIRVEMARDNAQVAAMTTEEFAVLMKAAFREHSTPIAEELIAALRIMLDVKMQGSTATVTMPDAADSFLLKRRAGTWRITHFPKR